MDQLVMNWRVRLKTLDTNQRFGLVAVWAHVELLAIILGCGAADCLDPNGALRIEGAGIGAAIGFALAAVILALIIQMTSESDEGFCQEQAV